MKKIALFACGVILAGATCQRYEPSSAVTTDTSRYLSFSMVTQEFGYSEEAIAAVNHIIDIHEQYDVPLDLIVDDASMQLYASQAPDVIERLKTSPVVAVSYHTRPPTPYYQKFDFAGLKELSSDELYNRILQYEEHGTDLVTGEPTDHAGGYQFVKDQIGYAPIMVGMITEPEFAPTLLKIYAEKGAQFVVEHRDEPIEPNQYRDDLMIRPETVPLIYTEHLTDTPEQLIADQFANAPAVDGPVFMSIKTHDNDFFATQSAWLSVYYNQGGRGTPQPPFDLSVQTDNAELLSADEQTQRWEHYASAVQYAAEHRTEFNLINAKQLADVVTATADQADTVVTNDQANTASPIYLTIVSHNEEPDSNRYPNFVENEAAFWEHRAAVLKFAEAVTAAGAKYDWQSDWNFLQAVAKYDTGTADTNGKNIVRYLSEDLGVEVDPHAHERNYNYADVAYLIAQLGVEPSGVVGGFLVYPTEQSKLEYLWEPITSTLDSSYTWQAELLWGGGSPNHVSDYNVSGMWRPASNEQYLTSADTAPLPNIGGYTGTWDGVADLLAKQAAGELEAGHMYTATVMVNQDEMLDDATITDTVNQIQQYQAEVENGQLQWINLADAISIWMNQYQSAPTIYRANDDVTTRPDEKRSNTNTTFNRNVTRPSGDSRGSCGDGFCTPFEQKSQACSSDC
jgi:hypothetical protein